MQSPPPLGCVEQKFAIYHFPRVTRSHLLNGSIPRFPSFSTARCLLWGQGEWSIREFQWLPPEAIGKFTSFCHFPRVR